MLRPCYTVKQVSRYLYHATFCIMILVSLHIKSSSTFHAVCLQIEPAKMENPDNEDIILQIEETFHLFLWSNNITTFPPFQSCFIYHVLLFVDDVVTSWPQTKISDWSGITMYRDPCCTEYWNMFYPKVCIMQLLKVVWHRARVITLLHCIFWFMIQVSWYLLYRVTGA